MCAEHSFLVAEENI